MASNWLTARLGDVVDLFDSQRVPLNSRQRQERQGGFPYYGAQGIIDYIDDYIFDGRYILVAEDGENLNSKKLPLALFATGRFWVNNHAHILRGKPGIADDAFLLACLNNADIKAFVTGAAQPKLSQGNLRLIEIPFPPLPIQRRIAGILSAYDDLIENSQRRIKILETMARSLYREWFVHFRFPGHENHPRVASPLGEIPEGWEVKKLGELISIDKGVSYNGAGLTDDGNPMVNLKNILAGGGFRRDATKPYSGDFKPRHTVKPGDVILANTDLTQAGNIVASAAMVPRMADDRPILTSHHLFAVRIPSQLPPAFIYHLLLEDAFRGFAKGHAIGTTVLGLPKEGVLNFTLALPPDNLIGEFVRHVAPLHKAIETIVERAENLRRTRDLLLPRLLSGQIALDEIEAT